MFFTGGSRDLKFLRKDTIAGKCAFSFFSVYSCNFSLLSVFLHAKIRYGGKAGWEIEGDRTTCARIIFRETDIRFKTEFDSGLIDEDKSGSEGAVLKWYLNGIKTLAVMGNNTHRKGKQQTPR
jgi:hypothetical protein